MLEAGLALRALFAYPQVMAINPSFFPSFNPVAMLGGFQPLGKQEGPSWAAPPPTSGVSANDLLGDAWQRLASGAGSKTESNPMMSQFQALYGKDEGAPATGERPPAEGAQDEETRELLKKRPDITPKEVQQMKSELRSAFKEPAMMDAAYKRAMQALGDGGSSAKPEEMGKLMSQLSSAAGKNGASAALDMFDKGRELLQSGKTPQDVGALAEGAQALAGGDGGSPNNVARMFETAAKTVQSRPDTKPGEIAQTAKVIAGRFPGKDPTERMAAFESGTKMMGESASMDAKGLDAMLARGQEQGLKGPKLLRSFESQGQAMREGALNAGQLGDKSTKNLSFNKEGQLQRERTSSQASPNQKMTQLGKEQSQEGRRSTGAPGAPRPAGKGGASGAAPQGAGPGGGEVAASAPAASPGGAVGGRR